MRVRQDNRVYRGGVERQIAVLSVGLLTLPLKETAIEQYALTSGFNHVHGAGYGTCGSPKCYFHHPSKRVMVPDITCQRPADCWRPKTRLERRWRGFQRRSYRWHYPQRPPTSPCRYPQ